MKQEIKQIEALMAEAEKTFNPITKAEIAGRAAKLSFSILVKVDQRLDRLEGKAIA